LSGQCRLLVLVGCVKDAEIDKESNMKNITIYVKAGFSMDICYGSITHNN